MSTSHHKPKKGVPMTIFRPSPLGVVQHHLSVFSVLIETPRLIPAGRIGTWDHDLLLWRQFLESTGLGGWDEPS